MRSLGLVILVLFLAGVTWLIATSDRVGVHSFEGRCGECHLGEPESGLFVGSIDRLCLRCHRDEAERSHPSDFPVSRKLPSRFPLKNGQMTCVTCHIPHPDMGSSDETMLQAEGNPFLLRYDQTGRAFCFQCHNPEYWSSGDSHGTALSIAHQESRDPEALALLDGSSRECLACHDGSIASNTDTGGASWEHAAGVGLSHPIGILYEDPLRKSQYRYRPAASLPKEIRLVNGRIECITCHDHYSKRKKLLVMDNTGSRLCLSCHEM